MSGRIVAEYEDYSLYESKLSAPVAIATSDFVRVAVVGGCESLPIRTAEYFIAQSCTIRVSTYDEALLEPEWEIFS